MTRVNTLMLVGFGVIAVLVLANVYILESAARGACGRSGCDCPGGCTDPGWPCEGDKTRVCGGDCGLDACGSEVTCDLVYCINWDNPGLSPQCGPKPAGDCNGQG